MNIREWTIAQDPDWVDAYRLIDLFKATGGGCMYYSPHAVLAIVKELKGKTNDPDPVAT